MRRKPSKAQIKNKCEGTFEEIKEAVTNGAILETVNFWNCREYWIKYPKGGTHRITKRIYDKLNTNH